MRHGKVFLGLKLVVATMAIMGLAGCEVFNSVDQSIKKITGSKPKETDSVSQANLSASTQASLDAVEIANCPKVKLVDELNSVYRYVNPVTPQDKDLISNAKFTSIEAGCNVTPASVTVEISANFDGKLGPAAHDVAPQEHFTYPYFVTVVTPQGDILSKDIFAMTMIYQDDKIPLKKQERLRQTIPLSGNQNASDFQIFLGFQLDPNELSYNRTHMALNRKETSSPVAPSTMGTK